MSLNKNKDSYSFLNMTRWPGHYCLLVGLGLVRWPFLKLGVVRRTRWIVSFSQPPCQTTGTLGRSSSPKEIRILFLSRQIIIIMIILIIISLKKNRCSPMVHLCRKENLEKLELDQKRHRRATNERGAYKGFWWVRQDQKSVPAKGLKSRQIHESKLRRLW